ncbi:MAG: transporter substrate-binding domain-containing protein [Eubacterium sp.]|nr:transporter substrate-binding domain-containing protein [Candidatus Colimonas fimequi]
MKKLLSLALAAIMVISCFALVGCGSNSQSNDGPDSDVAYVQDKGTLVVGITDFAPMDYKDDNGEWIGFDADLATSFASSLGVDVEFIEINWDSKEMELENKNIDCVWNGMTLTDGVKEAMETSNAYCNDAQVMVTTKANKDIDTVEGAAGLNFAVEAGSAGEEQAQANGYNSTGVETQADAVMEVAAGTADACIIDSLMAGAMVGEGTSYPDLVVTQAFNEELYGVGFRKGSDLAAKCNEFFTASYSAGVIQDIAKKYGTQESIIEQ